MKILRTIASRPWVWILLVLVLASFFRLWRLDSVPPGLYPDEALNANQAWEAAFEGTYRAFYPENNGREGLFMALVAFSYLAFGASVWSFRLVPALAGIATAGGVIFLAYELVLPVFHQRKKVWLASLLAGFLTATSFWHVLFSRIGFRAVLTPLALCLAFGFLLRALRTKTLGNAAAAGIFFGLGLSTYISFRLAVLPLLVLLLIWAWIALQERWAGRFAAIAGSLSVATVLFALPLVLYFVGHPEDVVSRASGISVLNTTDPVAAFASSFGKHALMFAGPGDGNWRHNFSGAPQILFPLSIFFLWGIAYAVVRIIPCLRKGSFRELASHKTLLALLFFLLLPGALTFEGVPHALRVIGTIPAAMILTSMGLVLGHAMLQQKKGALFANKALAALLLVVGIASFQQYFILWGERPEVREAFTQRFTQAGEAVLGVPLETQAFLVASEGDLPLEVPIFLQRSRNGREFSIVSPEQLNDLNLPPKSVLVTMNGQTDQLAPLKARYPEARVERRGEILLFSLPDPKMKN